MGRVAFKMPPKPRPAPARRCFGCGQETRGGAILCRACAADPAYDGAAFYTIEPRPRPKAWPAWRRCLVDCLAIAAITGALWYVVRLVERMREVWHAIFGGF